MKTKKTQAMIISVGGTPQPLVTSIEHHCPPYVCFFASQGTYDIITQVKESLGERTNEITFEVEIVDNENDLVECYNKGRNAISRPARRGIPKEGVIVDYTGGTKNMSVALALAAIDAGYGFSYVGGDRRTKGGVGIVETGHERVYTHVNPWDFMALKERRRVSELFNTFQFKAAMELLRDLSENASTMRSTYRFLTFLAEGYYFWDLFRHAEARGRFEKVRFDDLLESSDPGVRQIAQDTRSLLDFLEKLIQCSDRGKKPCRPMIFDLIANADRRYEEGKIDDAILRLYRVVEMLAQERLLVGYGIDTGNVLPEQIPEPIRDRFCERHSNQRTCRVEIPQNAAFELLKELGDPLGERFFKDEKTFREVQSARNTSYLAHGFSSSRNEVFQKFREFVSTLAEVSPDDLPRFPRLTLD